MRVALTYNEKRSLDEADAEFDTRDSIVTIARVVAGLGHEPVPIDVNGSVARLATRLERLAPDLVFNFAEGERGSFREAFYPALFEHLGLAHTGSSASTLALCLDKALAKRVVAAARVRVPRRAGPPPVPSSAGGIVIVKPNFEGSSKGITIVTDASALDGVIADTAARYPCGVIVEEFVPGIDVSVGWFAGIGLLPPIWYRYDGAIYDYALKHVTPERVHVEIGPPLAPGVTARLETAALRTFAALGVTGYGRADFRITPDGDVVFLEMNPLPSLTLTPGHDELYVAAARTGRTPRELIAAILDVGVSSPIRRCA